MNTHSLTIGYIKNNFLTTSSVEFREDGLKMAERTGLEPARDHSRRFSRPLHYQLYYLSARRADTLVRNFPKNTEIKYTKFNVIKAKKPGCNCTAGKGVKRESCTALISG